MQASRARASPIAVPAARSRSQERDPDYPGPSSRPRQQSNGRGQAASQPIPQTSTGRDTADGQEGDGGRTTASTSTRLPRTPRGRAAQQAALEPIQEQAIIETLQSGFLELEAEVDNMRIEMQSDREKIESIVSELTRLTNLVGESLAELSRAELVELRARVNELSERTQQVASPGSITPQSRDLMLSNANGSAACLGEAVTRLVLSSVAGTPNCRRSCRCSGDRSSPMTPRS